ncbi:YceH family protein [Aliikangiella sp. G2MR2-5]|uniref:YceH family protein n=1 Tax=Aliikangiella sp. G2MR2-5 TaxID=2788943 RepID=UPI0018AA7FB9|nr:YceH family protein [Aliikangiella sp. G2MR2-5]
MKILLNPVEQRIIGCLIEKSITTPDQYPLSLNALTNACNQKTNREPVMSLSEGEVQDCLDQLKQRHLVMTQAGISSRVAKYNHRFCNTEFGDLQLTAQERGIICVMLLRGPQTPGELRARTNRLCEFDNVVEVESLLREMASVSKGYVVALPREPGKREIRYQHCFQDLENMGEIKSEKMAEQASENSGVKSSDTISGDSIAGDRITQLEERVEMLELEIQEIYEKLNSLSQ